LSQHVSARAGRQAFDGYFQSGKPYLDGYKIFFVKSGGVVPGILGGQFDSEFRGRKSFREGPAARQDEGQSDGARGHLGQQPDASSSNTTRKPFDDIKVRQALTMAIDVGVARTRCPRSPS
jgi:peptide/nickel transport system substrate-binding protein